MYIEYQSINQAPTLYFCLRNPRLRNFSVLIFLSSSATVKILYTDVHVYWHLCSCPCTEGSCLSMSVYCSVNSVHVCILFSKFTTVWSEMAESRMQVEPPHTNGYESIHDSLIRGHRSSYAGWTHLTYESTPFWLDEEVSEGKSSPKVSWALEWCCQCCWGKEYHTS